MLIVSKVSNTDYHIDNTDLKTGIYDDITNQYYCLFERKLIEYKYIILM